MICHAGARTLFLALAILFAGASNSAAATPYHIRTIAIISAIGSDVTMLPGSILSSPDDIHLLQTDWKIDDLVVQQVANVLRQRYSIVTVSYDAEAFRAARPGSFGNFWSVFGDMIAALPRTSGVDAYVLVMPNYGASPGANIALERTSHLSLGSPATFLYVPFLVGVYAPSGDRLDWGTGKFPGPGTLTGTVLPMRRCPFSFWADTPAELTEVQLSGIRNEIAYLLGRGIPYALASANLISSDEAHAADSKIFVSDACEGL